MISSKNFPKVFLFTLVGVLLGQIIFQVNSRAAQFTNQQFTNQWAVLSLDQATPYEHSSQTRWDSIQGAYKISIQKLNPSASVRVESAQVEGSPESQDCGKVIPAQCTTYAQVNSGDVLVSVQNLQDSTLLQQKVFTHFLHTSWSVPTRDPSNCVLRPLEELSKMPEFLWNAAPASEDFFKLDLSNTKNDVTLFLGLDKDLKSIRFFVTSKSGQLSKRGVAQLVAEGQGPQSSRPRGTDPHAENE